VTKKIVIIFFFFTLAGHLIAQDRLLYTDSVLSKRIDRLNIPKADTLVESKKADLLSKARKIKADSSITKLQGKVDSLKSLKLPADKYIQKMDSVKAAANGTKTKIKSKADSVADKISTPLVKADAVKDSLQQKINKPIETAQKKIDEKTAFLDSLNINVSNPITGKATNYGIDGVDTNIQGKLTEQVKIPETNLPGKDIKLDDPLGNLKTEVKVPELNRLDNAKGKVNDLKQLPKDKLAETGLMDEVNMVKDKAQQAKEVVGKADAYKEDIEKIKDGGLQKAENLPKELENAATNIDEVKEFSAETKKFEQTKNVLQEYQQSMRELNEKALLDKGKDLGKKELADHFTGNEEKLKSGVAQLDKLKAKYGNIADSRYLPKRAPNPLKSKPFIERIIPGINFQTFKKGNLVNVDLSPFVAYRIYPRWRAAVGGTYRFQLTKKIQPVTDDKAFGFRVFTNYKVFRGFHLHVEGEWMRAMVYDPYSQQISTPDDLEQKWVPGLYGGLLKEYKVGKRINGNFQVLYNFLFERNGLYPAKVNMRFGFEFPMKKKARIVKEGV
jgi:hypothetical protein